MSKDNMNISRDTNVYSFTVERNGRYQLTVCNGIPITIEWEYDFNISKVQKKKIESSQPEFESALKVCMSNLLKNNFGNFMMLYKELKTNPKSKYFYDIQSIAEDEYRKISLKARELEILLEVEIP